MSAISLCKANREKDLVSKHVYDKREDCTGRKLRYILLNIKIIVLSLFAYAKHIIWLRNIGVCSNLFIRTIGRYMGYVAVT